MAINKSHFPFYAFLIFYLVYLTSYCAALTLPKISQLTRRAAISFVWPNGIIPYTFDSGFAEKGKDLFLQTAVKLGSKTCIRFREKNPTDTHWIIPTHGDNKGCGSSHVGRNRNAKNGQPLTVADFCLNPSVFEHEMGHMLAFPHEQDRFDRDEYITWDNTLPTCPPNSQPAGLFKDMDQAALDIFYDYVSIMHDWKECIRPKLPGPITIGANGPGHEVNTYSVLDYEKLNAIYDCDGCHGYRFIKVTHLAYNQNPILAGMDLDEHIYYICRQYHEGSIIIGKAKPDSISGQKCFIGAEGKEHEYNTDFEVLTNPKKSNFVWIKRPDDFSIPSNAVAGGRTVYRDTVYIGRCRLEINDKPFWTPGTLYIGNKTLGVPFGGGERFCTDYEILICAPLNDNSVQAKPKTNNGI